MIIQVATLDSPPRQLIVTGRTGMSAVHALLQLQPLPPPEWRVGDGSWAMVDPDSKFMDLAQDLKGGGSSHTEAFEVRGAHILSFPSLDPSQGLISKGSGSVHVQRAQCQLPEQQADMQLGSRQGESQSPYAPRSPRQCAEQMPRLRSLHSVDAIHRNMCTSSRAETLTVLAGAQSDTCTCSLSSYSGCYCISQMAATSAAAAASDATAAAAAAASSAAAAADSAALAAATNSPTVASGQSTAMASGGAKISSSAQSSDVQFEHSSCSGNAGAQEAARDVSPAVDFSYEPMQSDQLPSKKRQLHPQLNQIPLQSLQSEQPPLQPATWPPPRRHALDPIATTQAIETYDEEPGCDQYTQQQGRRAVFESRRAAFEQHSPDSSSASLAPQLPAVPAVKVDDMKRLTPDVAYSRIATTLPHLVGGSHLAIIDTRRGARDSMAQALLDALPKHQAGVFGQQQRIRGLALTFDKRDAVFTGLDCFWRWVLQGLHKAAPDLFPSAGLPSSSEGFEAAFSLERQPDAPPVVLLCMEAHTLAEASPLFVSRLLGTLRDMGGDCNRFFLHAVAMVGGASLERVDMHAYTCNAAPSQNSSKLSQVTTRRSSQNTPRSTSHNGSSDGLVAQRPIRRESKHFEVPRLPIAQMRSSHMSGGGGSGTIGSARSANQSATGSNTTMTTQQPPSSNDSHREPSSTTVPNHRLRTASQILPSAALPSDAARANARKAADFFRRSAAESEQLARQQSSHKSGNLADFVVFNSGEDKMTQPMHRKSMSLLPGRRSNGHRLSNVDENYRRQSAGCAAFTSSKTIGHSIGGSKPTTPREFGGKVKGIGCL